MDNVSEKLVIRNVGMMLSGKIEAQIIDADCVIAIDGKITAFARRLILIPRVLAR